MLRAWGTAIALALTSALLAIVPGGAAEAIAGCPADFPDGQTYVWDASVTDGHWLPNVGAENWLRPPAYAAARSPHENHLDNDGDAPGPVYACIPAGVTVRLDKFHDWFNYIQALYLAPGARLVIGEGTGVFVNSQSVASKTEANSEILVDRGSLGGEGTLHAHGLVRVSSSNTAVSALGSNFDGVPGGSPPPAHAGRLVVETDGRLELPAYGVNFWRKYQIEVFGSAVLSGNGFLAVHYDSRLTVQPGGTLEFAGTGGFYEGFKDAGDLVSLVNNGTILKSGPGTVIIGSDYEETGGEIKVTGGTLAFAGGTTYSADVAPGQALSTQKCAVIVANEPCVPEVDPVKDLQDVTFVVPTGDVSGAPVQVQELAAPATSIDSKGGVGNVFLAHADPAQLTATPANPAVLVFRTGAEEMGTPHVADFGIVHEPDGGGTELLPACLGDGTPPSGTGCVDRRGLPGSSYADAQNVYLVVRTTETSRYVCHKEDVTAPTVGLAAARWKSLRKPIQVVAKADESGSLAVRATVSGKLRSRGRARKVDLPLKAFTLAAVVGVDTAITLKLSKRQRARLRGARKVKVLITVTASDAGAHTRAQTVTVRLS